MKVVRDAIDEGGAMEGVAEESDEDDSDEEEEESGSERGQLDY